MLDISIIIDLDSLSRSKSSHSSNRVKTKFWTIFVLVYISLLTYEAECRIGVNSGNFFQKWIMSHASNIEDQKSRSIMDINLLSRL